MAIGSPQSPPSSTPRARVVVVAVVITLCMLVLCMSPPRSEAFRIQRPWSTRHWCEVLINPHFPFAYSKHPTQGHEAKGVIVDNTQHLGHECVTRGARTKCHRCENIACDTDLDEMCHYQIQGMNWANLPKNIPTLNNMPWAVGPAVQHRNDWGNAERACVMLTGDDCILDTTTDFDKCAVRCVGTGSPGFTPTPYGWTTPTDRASVGHPQGNVSTLAGTGFPGYVDGPGDMAQFSNPLGVAVDRMRNVYVADENNHRIRKITPSGFVTTLAGSGDIGDHGGAFRDGDALTEARFSSPSSIALYYDWEAYGDGEEALIVLVSDTNNHKIRRIHNGTVTTLGGGERGLADGWGMAARMDTPHGIAVRDDGTVYVCDTLNFLIRKITPDGYVSTLAGTTIRSPYEVAGAGCPAPCLDGVPGSQDGPLRSAKFYYPYDIAIADNGTVVIVDGDRIRRLNDDNATVSEIQTVQSRNRVYTIAGGFIEGDHDGIGQEATFNKPRGIIMSAEGRMYVADSVGCRIRRISQAYQVARPLTCDRRMQDEIRPSGCTMYDMPVDEINLKSSPVSNNIYYNYGVNFLMKNGDREKEKGLKVEPCVGSPEPDIGVTSNHETLGPYQGTGFVELDEMQDLNDQTTFDFECPPGCGAQAAAAAAGGGSSGVVGNFTYADISLICATAVHAGVVDDAVGGRFTVQLHRNWGPGAAWDYEGKNRGLEADTRNGITSEAAPDGWIRTFRLQPYPITYVEVQTIIGAPNAPLQDNCGYRDGQPPQGIMMSRPTSVAVYVNASLSDGELLYVADSNNHRIRKATAVCSKLCENEGYCITEEKCACKDGWTGDDCSQPVCDPGLCSENTVCTAPNECTCKPGFTGVDCDVATCVQECVHGACVAPDTCQCDFGWFDPNCTTPVCSQTCGNGGNCTAPDVCTCPTLWTGNDCREVICDQTCIHGHCIAPSTCLCDIGWSGYDCSKPICHQGFLRKDPTPFFSFSPLRPETYDYYSPCNISDWCDATNEFDCKQHERTFTNKLVPGWRSYNGHREDQGECMMMELKTDADTHYQYENEEHILTRYARHTPLTPYQWGPTRYRNPWSSPTSESVPDRQVAHVQWHTVSQGVYVCANGGNCSAPDVCVCADGWIGFDCRIPVCKQGYHEPHLKHARVDNQAVQYIEENPGTGLWQRQGVYECSGRPLTIWEHPTTIKGKFQAYVHDHPNYFSRYMDATFGWDDLHFKKPDLNDHTDEGWRRDGWWETTGAVWLKGDCQNHYNRTCFNQTVQAQKGIDLRDYSLGEVDWTDQAFEPRISYSIWNVTAEGRWFEDGGECVDEVLQGCYNNGTCIAPDTCLCAPGWEGEDCSVPICKQSVKAIDNAWGINASLIAPRSEDLWDTTHQGEEEVIQYRECPNRGNCTLPDICTCEKGWEGDDCTIPICAQECLHDGVCVEPDTCQCVTWDNRFRDGRDPPRPLFQQDDGEAQRTGWTGYDCSTPICVQAAAWIQNEVIWEDGVATPTVVLEKTTNAGESFQAGCATMSEFILRDSPHRNRTSSYLCNVEVWYQGVYQESWANALEGDTRTPISRTSKGRYQLVNFPDYYRDEDEVWHKRAVESPGEGVYACYNLGSCIAPDTCACADGWSGYDCNTPLCRHYNYFNVRVGCLNNGICADKDFCNCTLSPSILHEVEEQAPEGATGYNGSDCSMAICTQGWYDPDCILVPPERTGVASGGEGCYRCANGGNCTAPDFCTCTHEWQGYDCRTPVCTAEVDAETLFHLNTVDPLKVLDYEGDPCGQEILKMWNGALVGQGNCTNPNICTCLCRDRTWLDEDNEYVELPWLDPLNRELPPGFGTGFSDCLDGFQGNLNPDGTFRSCHQQIYVPSVLERYSVTFIVLGVLTGFFGTISYFSVRRRIALRQQLLKEERRRSRRSSEDQPKASAFTNA